MNLAVIQQSIKENQQVSHAEASPALDSLPCPGLCRRPYPRATGSTGYADEIDLGGNFLVFWDGILLDGQDLYVVQNVLNQIAVVRLAPDLLTGHISNYITSPAFRVPATVAEFGSSLCAVNARFDVGPPPAPAPRVDFEGVKVARR